MSGVLCCRNNESYIRGELKYSPDDRFLFSEKNSSLCNVWIMAHIAFLFGEPKALYNRRNSKTALTWNHQELLSALEDRRAVFCTCY